MKKKYTIEIETVEGNSLMKRTNDGFSALELLGLAELLKEDILKQARGIIEPDIVKRTVITD